MKKLSIFTTILFALGLYMLPAAFAADNYSGSKDKQYGQGEYQKGQKTQAQTQPGKQAQKSQLQNQSLVLVENLNGAEVLNPQGENIGEFENVLVDVRTGQVAFVTLTSGGILGVGEEKYIVPFNALKNETPQRTDEVLGVSQMRFTLNKTKDQLKKVPDGDIEEALSQEDQSRGIFEHYGVAPYWEEDQRQKMQNMNKDQMMDKNQMMDKKDQQKNQKKY